MGIGGSRRAMLRPRAPLGKEIQKSMGCAKTEPQVKIAGGGRGGRVWCSACAALRAQMVDGPGDGERRFLGRDVRAELCVRSLRRCPTLLSCCSTARPRCPGPPPPPPPPQPERAGRIPHSCSPHRAACLPSLHANSKQAVIIQDALNNCGYFFSSQYSKKAKNSLRFLSQVFFFFSLLLPSLSSLSFPPPP